MVIIWQLYNVCRRINVVLFLLFDILILDTQEFEQLVNNLPYE